jgi:hypothetical protein
MFANGCPKTTRYKQVSEKHTSSAFSPSHFGAHTGLTTFTWVEQEHPKPWVKLIQNEI